VAWNAPWLLGAAPLLQVGFGVPPQPPSLPAQRALQADATAALERVARALFPTGRTADATVAAAAAAAAFAVTLAGMTWH
jgi:hypothetical protein